jgi:hypothetical protein
MHVFVYFGREEGKSFGGIDCIVFAEILCVDHAAAARSCVLSLERKCV